MRNSILVIIAFVINYTGILSLYVIDAYLDYLFDGVNDFGKELFIKPIIPTFVCFTLIIFLGRVKGK